MATDSSILPPKVLKRIVPAEGIRMGPNLVKQPLPAPGLRQVGPFILLHHFGPTTVHPGEPALDVGAHPHRGFQPATILFQGALRHRDSLGNDGVIQAGEVQWITAGSGIIHSERVSDQFLAAGGTLEGIQLWVNLPARHKMMAPGYQEVRADEIPIVTIDDLNLRVIAGEIYETKGPVKPFSPLSVAVGELPENGTSSIQLQASSSFALYLVKGKITLPNGRTVQAEELALFDETAGTLDLVADEAATFLWLHGEAIAEPMAQYGPFVMNRPEEIQQAISDFQAGKMGELVE